MSSLRDEFARRDHHPSDQQYAGLTDLVGTMARMAGGGCPPQFHLSSLDPGVGKTTALTHFVAKLRQSPRHGDVAVLVCVAFKTEIEAFVADMAALDIPNSEIGVLTSDGDLNARGQSATNRPKSWSRPMRW